MARAVNKAWESHGFELPCYTACHDIIANADTSHPRPIPCVLQVVARGVWKRRVDGPRPTEKVGLPTGSRIQHLNLTSGLSPNRCWERERVNWNSRSKDEIILSLGRYSGLGSCLERTDNWQPHRHLQTCTDQPTPSIKPPAARQNFLLFSFSSPSKCRGFTCISEDSSEITFLLVENYNLTAPVGSIPDREFLAPIRFRKEFSLSLHLHRSARTEARKGSGSRNLRCLGRVAMYRWKRGTPAPWVLVPLRPLNNEQTGYCLSEEEKINKKPAPR